MIHQDQVIEMKFSFSRFTKETLLLACKVLVICLKMYNFFSLIQRKKKSTYNYWFDNTADTHPDSSRQATQVSYNAVLLWILQVGVPLRVLWGYSDATMKGATTHAVVSEYPRSTFSGIWDLSVEGNVTIKVWIGRALGRLQIVLGEAQWLWRFPDGGNNNRQQRFDLMENALYKSNYYYYYYYFTPNCSTYSGTA